MANIPKLVGLMGAKGSGKSTFAQLLVEDYGFMRLSFGRALKDMLRPLGVSEKDLNGDAKESPHPGLDGKTPRYALQTLGTEWGRDMISPRLWENVVYRDINAIWREKPEARIVIDDVRFRTEVNGVHERGGAVMCLRRSQVEPEEVDLGRLTLLCWKLFPATSAKFGLKRPLHPSETFWRRALAEGLAHPVHNHGVDVDELYRENISELLSRAHRFQSMRHFMQRDFS